MTLAIARPRYPERLLIVYDNVARAAAGATIACDSAILSCPPERMLDERSDTAWRSGSIAIASQRSETIDLVIRFGRQRLVDWASIHGHNVRVPWRVIAYAGEPESSKAVGVSEWTDPLIRAELDEYGWLELPWTLGPDPETLARMTAAYELASFIQLDAPVQARSIKISLDISSRSNGVSNHFQVGDLIAGCAFQPLHNKTWGWGVAAEDLTEFAVSHRGQEFSIERPCRNSYPFSLEWLTRDEGRRLFEEWFRARGKKAIVFAWPEPDRRRDWNATAKRYRIEQMPQLSVEFSTSIAGVKGFRLLEIL